MQSQFELVFLRLARPLSYKEKNFKDSNKLWNTVYRVANLSLVNMKALMASLSQTKINRCSNIPTIMTKLTIIMTKQTILNSQELSSLTPVSDKSQT